MILVSRSEARRKGADPALVTSAVIVVAIFALVGARLYHVLGEWQTYADDPLRAILPPYAGLGLYGGIIGAAIGIWVFLRGKGIPLSRALDIVVPGHAPRPGHRPLGQLLQPGALRSADRPALGHRHRLRPPHRPGPLRALSGGHGLPSALLLRVGSHHRGRPPCVAPLSPLRRPPARRRPGLVLDDLVRERAHRPRDVPRGLELDDRRRAHRDARRRRPHHPRCCHHPLAAPRGAAPRARRPPSRPRANEGRRRSAGSVRGRCCR